MLARVMRYFKRWGFVEGLGRPLGELRNRMHTRIYSAIFRIELGPGAIIEPGAVLRRGGAGRIFIGAGSRIHSGARLLAHGGTISMGQQCSVNPNSILYGHGGLKIGDGVLIAAGTIIIPANHSTHSSQPIRGQGLTTKGITIDDDVWLGTGVTILDGSNIQRGAVIGAGAVVTGIDIEPMAIYGGIPAKRIGLREGISNDQANYDQSDELAR